MRAPVIALLAVVAMLGSCGGEEDDAAGITRSFLGSVAAGDGAAACAALSQSTREKLEKDEMAPCPEALLDRTAEGWRISGAGCKPAAPEEPYDCELES